MSSKILNISVEIFTENNIGEYTGNENLKVSELIDKYIKNQGFFVLEFENKFYGYLDLFSIEDIKRLLTEEHYKKEIKSVMNQINFKKDSLSKNDSLKTAKEILIRNNISYIPVINDEKKVIGRTNAEIINSRVKNLLKHGFNIADE